MLRDPVIYPLSTVHGNAAAPHKDRARRFLLLMETHTVRPEGNIGPGTIYRANVELKCDPNDAEAYARAMVEGWTKVLEKVKAGVRRGEGSDWNTDIEVKRASS